MAIEKEIPIKNRLKIAKKYSDYDEINNQFRETGDEWKTKLDGTIIDIICRDKDWISEDLKSVLVHHKASLGYTTAIWFNVLNFVVLYDKKD